MLVRSILLFILCFSCKYTTSPYSVEVPKLMENGKSIDRINRNGPQDPAEFRIAFISDTHNNYDDLNDLVDQLNKTGPYSFVVVSGDITNEGMRDEYLATKRILGRLNYPSLVVVGNHDLLSNGEKIYARLFGLKNFTLDYRDLSFVFLDNNNWESGGRVPDIDFLESSLAAAPGAFKIVVAHVSPDDSARFSMTEITDFYAILLNQGVDYMISGHNHNSSINMSMAGMISVTVGSANKRVYFELTRSAGGLTHKKVNF